jgi:hypothetical protein
MEQGSCSYSRVRKQPGSRRPVAPSRLGRGGPTSLVHESPLLDPAIKHYSFTLPFPIVELYGMTIGGIPGGGTGRKKGYMLYAILAAFLILSVISLISGHVASR